MPRGPRGEKRLANVIGNAVKVIRIATGEEETMATPEKQHIRKIVSSLNVTASRSALPRTTLSARDSLHALQFCSHP